ncbi:MAG: hypothetical protein J0M11_18250 [Anaerolineae bacterium]|nr:hypothetical protein [Anaerolineae bacterium]
MFYHIKIELPDSNSWIEENKTKEQATNNYVCPFINKEVTVLNEKIFNMSTFAGLSIYKTDKPIDSEYPIKKSDFKRKLFSSDSEETIDWYKYEESLLNKLKEMKADVTLEIFKDALFIIDAGEYKEIKKTTLNSLREKTVFFICKFDDPEVDHNYSFVIKPLVEKYQFKILRADEISHTGTITDAILDGINRSRFVIADLTGSRPNCYYEVGYAHSRAKPVIILAKKGTERHFDLSTHKWNYWDDYKDLKPTLERELLSILLAIGEISK